jgi:hypothetical protein
VQAGPAIYAEQSRIRNVTRFAPKYNVHASLNSARPAIFTAMVAMGKLPGGSQAHLIKADNGRTYVVKFTNTPQSRRILINEMVSAMLLKRLKLAGPEIAFIRITREFLGAHPDVYVQFRSGTQSPPAGLHFGSCLPGIPNDNFVSHPVSDAVLRGLSNLREFVGVLVFDKWTSNQDSRQCIFEFVPPYCVRALWIDNGHALGGPSWEFLDSPRLGVYFRHTVYERARSWADFEPWLEGVRAVSEEFVEHILKELPNDWILDDYKDLRRVVDRLLVRRQAVANLIEAAIASQPSAFPNWKCRCQV